MRSASRPSSSRRATRSSARRWTARSRPGTPVPRRCTGTRRRRSSARTPRCSSRPSGSRRSRSSSARSARARPSTAARRSASARDGTRLQLALTVSPLYGQDGEIVGASTIARDISERKARRGPGPPAQRGARGARPRPHRPARGRQPRARGVQLLGLARPARAAARDRRLLAHRARGARRGRSTPRAAATSSSVRRNTERHGAADRRPARVLAARAAASSTGVRSTSSRSRARSSTALASRDTGAGRRSRSATFRPRAPTRRCCGRCSRTCSRTRSSSRATSPSRGSRSDAYADDGSPVYFVRDNGVGFDMRYADKLFRRVPAAPPPGGFEGTGIGLAIVAPDRLPPRRHGSGPTRAAARAPPSTSRSTGART